MTNRRIIWAMMWEDESILSERRAWSFRNDLGIDLMRFTGRGWKINPAKGKYDLRELVSQVANARGAGLLAAITICYAPAWASGGFPAYDEYTRGCTRWKPGAKTINDIEFDTSKDYCLNPPNINKDWAYDLAVALMNAPDLRRSVWAWEPWNEIGGDLYWPPIHSEDKNGDAVVRWFEQFATPFITFLRGVRGVQIIGPNADGSDILRRILEYEREHKLNAFDGISAHAYPAGNPSVYDTIAQFEAIVEQELRAYDDDRPLMLNENGGIGNAEQVLTFIDTVVNKQKHDISMLGVPRVDWWEPGTFEADRPEVNAYGRELKRMIEANVKGRPVRPIV